MLAVSLLGLFLMVGCGGSGVDDSLLTSVPDASSLAGSARGPGRGRRPQPDALNAPFLVDSYAPGADVLRGASVNACLPVWPTQACSRWALLLGPTHLLLTRRPVARPADLRELKIATQASEVGEQTLRALGARGPYPSGGVRASRALDGVEQRVRDSFGPGYLHQAHYLTVDAPFWPGPLVVFANHASWDNLSGDQRAPPVSATRKVPFQPNGLGQM